MTAAQAALEAVERAIHGWVEATRPAGIRLLQELVQTPSYSGREGSADDLHDRLKAKVKVVMPLVTQFYGTREFAIEDPDAYILTFAARQG